MFKEPRIKADAGALYESLLLMRAFAEQQREHIRDYSKNLEEYIEEEEIETIVAGRENNDEMVTSPAGFTTTWVRAPSRSTFAFQPFWKM